MPWGYGTQTMDGATRAKLLALPGPSPIDGRQRAIHVPSIVKGKKVPCAKTFRRVLNQTSSGNHGPEEGVYGRQKLRQLKACLSEAARKLTLGVRRDL
eukprot:s963_g41.t1